MCSQHPSWGVCLYGFTDSEKSPYTRTNSQRPAETAVQAPSSSCILLLAQLFALFKTLTGLKLKLHNRGIVRKYRNGNTLVITK